MHAKQLMLAAGFAVAVFAAPVAAYAQSVPTAPAGAAKPAATGVKSYEAGTKAFEAGKFTSAISSLSNALSIGGLSSQQMAKALYYRGVAYRKTGKSAQAISDLTSAVWLKNGLSDADRASAMENRQGAYQEAGLGNATPIGTPPLDAPATAAVSAPPVAAAPAAVAAAAPAPADSATSSWTATSAKSAAEASVPNLSAPSGNYAGLSAPDAPTLSAVPESDIAAAPAANPLAGVGTAIGSAGTAVTGFFGNIFGGGSTATTAASTDVTTAAAPPAAPLPPPAPTVQAPPVAADWNSNVSVAPAGSQKPAKAEAKQKVAAVEKPRTTAAGKYRLQVGIVGSREEAEGISARLRAEHAASLGAAAPAIDEVTFGNGTFYRVQVGPYASAVEPGQFCSALKPKGYDCLVVTK